MFYINDVLYQKMLVVFAFFGYELIKKQKLINSGLQSRLIWGCQKMFESK